MNTKIQELGKKYEEYQIEMRRWFHANPELSGKEYETSKKVKEELDRYGIEWIDCGLETGVLATIKGGKPGKTVLLRADMDALAVLEETGVEYASKNTGVMHACGHDCHTSMLLTAARMFNDIKDELPGTVKLAFQPSEENGKGALSMVAQGAMEGVDRCFGLHVWSDVKSGKVSCQNGPRMGAAGHFTIKITGKGGHGAAPHQCVDALIATAAVAGALQTVVSRNASPMEPAVLTIGRMEAGTQWNIIPESGVLEGTIRCFDDELFDNMPVWIERVAKETAAAYGADAELIYEVIVPAVNNNPETSEIARNAIKKIMGEDCLQEIVPTMGGEDFTIFARKAPGTLALLGIYNEECDAVYAQHNCKYNVDESVLIKGAMIYVQAAMDLNA